MKKKIIIILAIVLTLGLIAGGTYLYLNKENENNYTIDEQRWIEDNKNKSIDVYMPSDILSLTSAGEGLFFDFTDYFNKNTGVKINPVAYQLGNEVNGNYSIQLVDKLESDDINFLTDEYVVISKSEENMYSNASQLSGLKVGVLESDKEMLPEYIGTDVQLTPYATKELLLGALKTDTVNCIIGLKTLYLSDILTEKYHINYHISDLNKYYIIKLSGEDDVVKSIIKKEFNKFKDFEYNKSLNSNLRAAYVKAYDITEQEMTNLNSKKYTYGYINNGMFDNTYHGGLIGTNYFVIKNFASFANIDMKYSDAYKSIDSLNNALENGNIDFYFNNTKLSENDKVKYTASPIKSRIAFVTSNNSKINLNSIASIKKYDVVVLKNSKLEKYLVEKGINVVTYDSYTEMFKRKNLKKTQVIALELENYEYYKTRGLSNYHITYIAEDNINYGFVSSNNELFIKLLNFYLEYTDLNSVIDINYVNVYEYEGLNIFLLIAVIILSLILLFQFIGKIKKFIVFLFKHRNKKLTKDDKIKYIDSLTSLKNRAYLNDNIEKWDNSEIYPQIIIIVDLNNISYINDNYGHEEGDKLIAEAANILIQTQLPNTDIIRTDGNEFLIYMVEYEEKKAVSYIRKLTREFKNLTHGFGAAIGYSIINDAIKTIDDAVNEATLDMKTNKEIMNEEEK